MNNWNHLSQIHYGKNFYIYGKGPEFSNRPKEPQGDVRICINETALHVPDPTYVVTLNQSTWQNLLPAFKNTNVIGLIDRKSLKHALSLGIPEDRLLPFARCEREYDILKWKPKEVAHCRHLFCDMGSAIPATHFAWFLGAQAINFVGFDGGVEYAPEFEGMKPSIYNDQIWQNIVEMCEVLGVGIGLHVGE